MCFGGGGGDGGAADRAQQRADAEAQRVKTAVANLNAMFGIGSAPGDSYDTTSVAEQNKAARDRIYSGIESAVSGLNMDTLNREYGNAGREVNFDAARRGLYGGSAYADNLSRLNEDRNTGIQKITTAAENAANQARAADDKTRLGLASQITSGLDEVTALQSAQNQLNTNASGAKDEAMAAGLQGFFTDLLTNLQRNTAQQGLINAATRSGYYGTTPSYGASSGSVYKG